MDKKVKFRKKMFVVVSIMFIGMFLILGGTKQLWTHAQNLMFFDLLYNVVALSAGIGLCYMSLRILQE